MKKFYALVEFPYPSGEGLHVGHLRPYIGMDVVARKKRLEGLDVLFPMGFDSFGLPAENFAIKKGIHPAITTQKNIKNYTRQMNLVDLSFDWDRTFSTTDPEYYKWTQWIFIQMFKKGLAYKTKMPINWCTSCKIGLANEEVVAGKCERCGGEVVKREKEQWMLKITKYADRLIDDLACVDYLEKIKQQQINWIGRSFGAEIEFKVMGSKNTAGSLKVFTTRADTIFGATFLVISPEHPLISEYENAPRPEGELGITNFTEVKKYVERAKNKSDLERTELSKEKTGVKLEGIYAINPANNKKIPIFVADYVLASYGHGAIMAVPAHDERDFEFTKKYDLEIIEVVDGDGKMKNSGEFDGLEIKEATEKIIQKFGFEKKINYKLRDWVFSRQRYWGEPIPMVYCEKCASLDPKGRGWQPVLEKDLPVLLPDVKKYEPTDTGESPLSKIESFVRTKCPKCGGEARRETDVMPNWAGSNWYYLAYVMRGISNFQFPISKYKKAFEYWIPVDWYNGGMEHTTLHLLYSRFVYKFLYDIGAVPKKCGSEPYKKRTSHGMILGEGGVKMSKSRGNVINPDEVAKEYGADTLRVYEMFIGPFDQAIPWDTKGIIGTRRFLERVEGTIEFISKSRSEDIERLLHKTIKKVTEDIDTMNFNTAVSQSMIFVNKVWQQKAVTKEELEKFLIIFSPFAPCLVEKLWQKLGHKKSIFKETWPKWDEKLIKEEKINLVVQVNGKVRGVLEVEAGISEEKALELVRGDERFSKYLAEKEIKKIIFIKDRLINIVI